MRDVGKNRGLSCKNCGAPVTSEICPFCGAVTGMVTAQADMQYPVLQCKEATLNFWTVAFPAIFAFSFGFFGFAFPFLFAKSGSEEMGTVLLISIPFALIGVVAFIIMLRPIIRFLILKSKGTRVTAKVYGYVDDNVLINDQPAQVVKLLVYTPEGYRFVTYQLGTTDQPYGINTEIELLVYKDIFMIEKQQKHYIKWN